MSRVLIWDLPTRLFHWLLVVGILSAFGIAQFAGEHGSLFPYHAIIGMTLATMLLFRLVWGFIGTKHARFTSFAFGPSAVVEYFKAIVTGRMVHYSGHNPASSWAIYAMLGLLATVMTSGLLMGGGNEAFEEVHSISVYALLVVAGIHVVGVILHSVRHRENIILAMVTGLKETESSAAIRSTRPFTGLVFLSLVVLVAAGLYRNYDPASRRTTIPLIGASILLAGSDQYNGNAGHQLPADRERHERDHEKD